MRTLFFFLVYYYFVAYGYFYPFITQLKKDIYLYSYFSSFFLLQIIFFVIPIMRQRSLRISQRSIPLQKQTSYVFETLNGDTISIIPQQYKATVLKFGIIDCLPCRESDIIFEKISNQYLNRKEICFAKINISDGLERIKSMPTHSSINIYSDKKYKNYNTFFKQTKVPCTLLLNSKGDILLTIYGYDEYNKAEYSKIPMIIDSI